MTRISISAFTFLFLAAACTNPAPKDQTSQEATATEPSALEVAEETSPEIQPETVLDEEAPGARPWSNEALHEQPRMKLLQAQTDPEMGAPATTEWRTSSITVPDSVLGEPNPAQLLFSFLHEARYIDALGVDVWEQTLRIHQPDETTAEAIILRWGIKDDSLAGMDLLLKMSTEDREIWHIDALQERFHCYRGVHEGLCL